MHKWKHSLQNTEEEPTTLGTTPAASAGHRRYLSSPAAATSHGKTQGFVLLPNTKPMQHSCSHYNCFAASRRKLARIYAHGNTRWQQSRSHSNAICNRRFKKRIELRTQEQLLVAEHRGGTKTTAAAAAPAAHTRYLSSPAGVTLHGKTQGFVRRLPPHFLPWSNTSLSRHFPNAPRCLHHRFSSSPLPFRTTSLRHNFPSSPFPFVTTSLRHHFPLSPYP